jgi:hypothetical protein
LCKLKVLNLVGEVVALALQSVELDFMVFLNSCQLFAQVRDEGLNTEKGVSL